MVLLNHLDADGKARMVDVALKKRTIRIAKAEGCITMQSLTWKLIQSHGHKKGDVLAVARVAAIMSAKRCCDLIPLCHPIELSQVNVEFEFVEDGHAVKIIVTTKANAATGVEMEALTAACVGLLTLYDMCKSSDRSMRIEGVHLLEKSGGRSGSWKVGDFS